MFPSTASFSHPFPIHSFKVIFTKQEIGQALCVLGPAKPRGLKVAMKDFSNAIYTRDTAAAFIWLFWLENSFSQAEADYIGRATKNLFIIHKISP